ncbi:MAG TPA: hypothetical protein VG498_11860, partial [Terriglobales bacterium]|nr:hypothetical protein [Terriglobales bacterium]
MGRLVELPIAKQTGSPSRDDCVGRGGSREFPEGPRSADFVLDRRGGSQRIVCLHFVGGAKEACAVIYT